jgi:hypothetical protein
MNDHELLNCRAMIEMYLPNTGIQTLQFFILGGHIGAGWFGGKDAHKSRQKSVHQADNLQKKIRKSVSLRHLIGVHLFSALYFTSLPVARLYRTEQ